jgi:hypothetical protein
VPTCTFQTKAAKAKRYMEKKPLSSMNNLDKNLIKEMLGGSKIFFHSSILVLLNEVQTVQDVNSYYYVERKS